MSTPPAFGLPPRSCPTQLTRVYDEEFAHDPAVVYRRLRAQHGPVAPVELAPGVFAHLVLGYEAALNVLRRPGTFPRDPRRWEQHLPPGHPVQPMMGFRPNAMFTDGAAHARYRGALADTIGKIDASRLREVAERSARDVMAGIQTEGTADLRGDYVLMTILAVFNQLFGCPPDISERHTRGMLAMFNLTDPRQAMHDLNTSMSELIGLKRQQPGNDIPSWLLGHPARLNDEELLHGLILLLGAATEPLLNLITNGIHLLLSDDRFANGLTGGTVSIDEALDHILWTDPPIANYCASYPRTGQSFCGQQLPADHPVVISFAAANLETTAAGGIHAGNRAHLAWSAGPHTCPAQDTARVIALAIIETLLDTLPDVRLRDGQPVQWRPGPFHRALVALPVRFTPVAGRGDGKV